MHLPIAAAAFFSIGRGLSEKTVSAIYAFLDMHTLLENHRFFVLPSCFRAVLLW